MAGALLTAAGLDELITQNLADYEARAVAIALDRGRLQRLRDALRVARQQGPLFDTPRLVRNLEAGFEHLVTGLG